MKNTVNIWEYDAPLDCNWYWRKLNPLKTQMVKWYQDNRYTLTHNGAYLVSCSYQALLGTLTKLKEADLIWNSVMLPRQIFITWLACQKRPPTRERLLTMSIQVEDENCCLCDERVLETQNHLFTKCRWTTNVKIMMCTWLGVQLPSRGVYETIKWFKRTRWKQFQKEVIAAAWGAFCLPHLDS